MKKRTAAPIEVLERKTRFLELLHKTPPKTVCPNFYVLIHANGCAFSPACAYCFLKSSFAVLPQPRAFASQEKMFREIRAWFKKDHLETFMLNTGNLSDSLCFEKARPLMVSLLELFRNEAEAKGRPHTLLLVTKGGLEECRPLLKQRPSANVIVSFSLNHPEAARLYEAGAAPIAERLKAAGLLIKKGWRVRLRMDPMIVGYDYRELADQVAALHPERVTLGAIRAEANLRRRVKIPLFDALEPSALPGGLARYPEKVRRALYRPVVTRLQRVCPVGLCEETERVWRAVGLDPKTVSCNCGL